MPGINDHIIKDANGRRIFDKKCRPGPDYEVVIPISRVRTFGDVESGRVVNSAIFPRISAGTDYRVVVD